MYVPPWHAVTDEATLFDFIEHHPFGLLVSQQGGEPVATHLPILIGERAHPGGHLLGHVARQNPQWKGLTGQRVLAVFQGPHGYISPSWYQSEHVVPTWNYTAVHVYGTVRLIDDVDGLVDLVRQVTETFERPMSKPWTLDVNDPFVRKLAEQIVGFAIDIERMEGKWKLNQNHPPERRRRVVAALREQGYPDAIAIADLMAKGLDLDSP
jgi:transcriptional regulator